jgi:hypothetical protein
VLICLIILYTGGVTSSSGPGAPLRNRNPEKPEYRIKPCQKQRETHNKAIRAQRKAQPNP